MCREEDRLTRGRQIVYPPNKFCARVYRRIVLGFEGEKYAQAEFFKKPSKYHYSQPAIEGYRVNIVQIFVTSNQSILMCPIACNKEMSSSHFYITLAAHGWLTITNGLLKLTVIPARAFSIIQDCVQDFNTPKIL